MNLAEESGWTIFINMWSGKPVHGTAIAHAVATVYARQLHRQRPSWQETISDLIEWVRNAARRAVDWGSRRLR